MSTLPPHQESLAKADVLLGQLATILPHFRADAAEPTEVRMYTLNALRLVARLDPDEAVSVLDTFLKQPA